MIFRDKSTSECYLSFSQSHRDEALVVSYGVLHGLHGLINKLNKL